MYGPPRPALQLTPTVALVCDVGYEHIVRVMKNASTAEQLYFHMNMQPAESTAVMPFVRRMVELDPPPTSINQVWGRTDTGIGSASPDLVPFLRVAGTKLWVRADTHASCSL